MYKKATKAIYPRHVQVIKWEFSRARDNFQILQFLSKQKGRLKEHPASWVRGCLNRVYLLSEESNLTLPPGSATSPTHCPSLAASQLRSSRFGGSAAQRNHLPGRKAAGIMGVGPGMLQMPGGRWEKGAGIARRENGPGARALL